MDEIEVYPRVLCDKKILPKLKGNEVIKDQAGVELKCRLALQKLGLLVFVVALAYP